MVEFALILPLLVILMLGIVDLARIYTTMLTVESAAREAADFGTFGSHKWGASAVAITEAQMLDRACTAASTLPDFVGSAGTCSNPAMTYELSGNRGASWQAHDPALVCDDATREPPCWLKVTLRYDFQLIAPFGFEAFGTTFGLPNTLTFERSSVYAMTDLELAP